MLKIRTQDANRFLEFGEVYAEQSRGRGAVYLQNRIHFRPVLVGVYEDIERARGVCYEIAQAYQNGERIFYAPAK